MSHMIRKPRIGLSLAWTYLGSSTAGRCAHNWKEFFGSSEEFLELLGSTPVTTIEFRHFDEVEDIIVVENAAKSISASPFDATVHGDIQYRDIDSDLFDILPWLPVLLSRIPDKIKDTVVTLHPVTSPDVDLRRSMDLTVKLISSMINMVEKEGIPIRFALEIQREKGRFNPGITYSGIMEMQKRINNPLLGVNWDMGHAYSNYQQGLIDEFPDESFVAATYHTHIHDLNSEGKTHWPLTEGRIPLLRNIGLLENAMYSGVYNLELALDRFAGENDAGKRILHSIDLLSSAVLTSTNELSPATPSSN